tara:strand:+ start:25067 stop:26125 length:1059 start_codon:yes stop_codon:yes gene_type:complete
MATNSQQSREVEQFKYQKAESKVIRLPQGEVIKEIHIMAKGKFAHTYASGSPTLKKHGVLDALCRGIRCVEDGNKIVKSYKGVKVLRNLSEWIQGSGLASYFKKNSSTLGAFSSVTKGFPDIGSTTEETSFLDTVIIPFDGKLSTEYARTRWNLRDKTDAYIQIDFNELADLLEIGSDAATVSADIDFYVSIVTSPALSDVAFAKWKQTFKEEELSGPAVEKRIDLISGGLQQGFWLSLEKGSTREPLTLEECLETKVKVILDQAGQGQSILKSTNLLELMAINENKTMIEDFIPSAAYVNFLDNKTFGTALNTGVGSGVQKLDLVLTTPAGISYSPNPLIVRVEHDTIEAQ